MYDNPTMLSRVVFRFNTPRKPGLSESISDLLQIFPFLEEFIKSCFLEYEDEPEKAVTKIWKGFTLITQLLNFALILDSAKNFKFDKSRLTFFEEYLSKFYQLKLN